MLKPLRLIPSEDCTGCGACVASCGLNCISMERDNRGFDNPMVDTQRCVHCMACARACPVLNYSPNEILPSVYACRAASDTILKNSSSGGLFSLIATEIISKGGAVCGTSFDGNIILSHHIVKSIEEIFELTGSKYVQSRAYTGMRESLRELRKGNKVLFCGTPCQVAGMRTLAGPKNSQNLFCIEIICHSIPSPGIFEKYCKELEYEHGAKISSFIFRDKSHGWKEYMLKVNFANGNYFCQKGAENPYIVGFLLDLYNRNCCSSCRFKGFKSGADITLGDFWGEKSLNNPAYSDNRGVSLVCVNTKAGADMFDRITPMLKDITPTDLETAAKDNPRLLKPTTHNIRSKRFYRNIKRHNIEYSINRAVENNLFDCILISARYRLGKLFKNSNE